MHSIEIEQKQSAVLRLQTALDTLEKQAARDKMIIKFRDQRILKLEQTLQEQQAGDCQ